MAKFLLLAINKPHEGADQEAEYNRWYDDIHIPDLEAIDGVVSARRYKIVMSRRIDMPYVAAYEVETDDIAAFMKDLETKPRPFTPALDRSQSVTILGMEMPRAEG